MRRSGKEKFGLRELEADCLSDNTIQALTEKVAIEPDQSLESSHPKRKGAEVHITLNDGRKLSKRIDLPKGEVENPVSRDELIMKFANCTDGYFEEDTKGKVVNKILRIDQVDNIEDLISML